MESVRDNAYMGTIKTTKRRRKIFSNSLRPNGSSAVCVEIPTQLLSLWAEISLGYLKCFNIVETQKILSGTCAHVWRLNKMISVRWVNYYSGCDGKWCRLMFFLTEKFFHFTSTIYHGNVRSDVISAPSQSIFVFSCWTHKIEISPTHQFMTDVFCLRMRQQKAMAKD